MSAGEDVEKGTPMDCWQPPWKTVWQFLRKVKTEPPRDPAIQLLRVYMKKMKKPSRKDLCISVFIAALFTIVIEA